MRALMVFGFAGLLLVSSSFVANVSGYIVPFVLEEVAEHHVVGLNSDRPYVAGFQVASDDLNTYGTVDGTAVTVSFLSVNASYLKGAWLAGGMFVQAQDTKYKNVDYGFYTVLAVDSSGSIFVDLGLHQTREETQPVQPGNEELVYAYTWRLSELQLTTPVTLRAIWDDQGFVSYFITVNRTTHLIKSVKVADFPNCEGIIPHFYGGNVINKPFPFSNYVNFFQFGVTSSSPVTDTHWSVQVENPQMLKNREWINVSRAWSIQGNIAFLDQDWKWGGQLYLGVSVQYFNHPLQMAGQLIFEYTGETLKPGIVLWNQPASQTAATKTAEPSPLLMSSFVFGFGVLWGVASRVLHKKSRRKIVQTSIEV